MGAVFYHIVSHSLLLWGGAVSLYNVLFFLQKSQMSSALNMELYFKKEYLQHTGRCVNLLCSQKIDSQDKNICQVMTNAYLIIDWLIEDGVFCILGGHIPLRVMLYPLKSWLRAGDPSFPPKKALKGNFSHYRIHWNTDHCVCSIRTHSAQF